MSTKQLTSCLDDLYQLTSELKSCKDIGGVCSKFEALDDFYSYFRACDAYSVLLRLLKVVRTANAHTIVLICNNSIYARLYVVYIVP